MDREQFRARIPDVMGSIERDGVRLAYEVFGEGPATVVLLPTWSIISSRHWKLQIPYLARHYRVVTFDGRGSGRSDRPSGAAAYTDAAYAEDVVAVLDATKTASAVLVGLSCGAAWAIHVAAKHPERVSGVFAIAPSCGIGVASPKRERFAFDGHYPQTDGWAKYNRRYWLDGGFDDFRQFFFAQMFSEEHSTKQIEDCLRWSDEVSPQTLADCTAGRLGLDGATAAPLERLCAQVRCPVHVVHGTDDRIRPSAVGEKPAALTGGELTLLPGAGHGPHARRPVLINTMLRTFVDQIVPSAPRPRRPRSLGHRRRVLFVSSPIGLGHARRDIAVADQLRRQHLDVEIDWLTQHPVTAMLGESGEHVHPASSWLLNESTHIEHESGEHDLHAFQALRSMDETMVNNFMVFDELVRDGSYDLVIADEAWDVDHFLHENPERKRFAYAWMTDFIGWLPMPDGGDLEVRLTADYNAEMLEHRARLPGLRDSSIFVGNPDDIVDEGFGPGLPVIRRWAEREFDFAGYVTGCEPPPPAQSSALRLALGYRPDHRLCVVSVGGSGVGESLLRRVVEAAEPARRLMPELRFLVVCGPRIDPASVQPPDGVRVVGYLPRLFEYLAAADIGVVQGGLTTCMELAASRTRFVYVPLEHHFEQNVHVRHRLERYRAGRHLSYAEASDPRYLAEVIVKELAAPVEVLPVESDGAERTAALLAQLL